MNISPKLSVGLAILLVLMCTAQSTSAASPFDKCNLPGSSKQYKVKAHNPFFKASLTKDCGMYVLTQKQSCYDGQEKWSYTFDLKAQEVELERIAEDFELQKATFNYNKSKTVLSCHGRSGDDSDGIDLRGSLTLPPSFPPSDFKLCVASGNGLNVYYSKKYDFSFTVKFSLEKGCELFEIGLPGQKKAIGKCWDCEIEKLWTVKSFLKCPKFK